MSAGVTLKPWLDDQLAATLRDRGSATTGELRESMSGVLINRPVGVCRCRCGQMEHPRFLRLPLDATHVLAVLRRLARTGRVVEVRTPNPNNGVHLWLWVDKGDTE